MKQIENLGETFLCASLSLSWSRLLPKCFLNFSSDLLICSCFYSMIVGSCRSDAFIMHI